RSTDSDGARVSRELARRSVDRAMALLPRYAAEPESVSVEPHGQVAQCAGSKDPAHHRRTQHLLRGHRARVLSGQWQPAQSTADARGRSEETVLLGRKSDIADASRIAGAHRGARVGQA